jgi:sarcosine oxidase subunit beta
MKRTLGADVAIIGGGIVGCAAAYYLAQRDVAVVLLERSVIGGEASGRNAGGVRAQCRDRRERSLAMASIEIWEGLEAELGFDVEYVQGGNLRLATHEQRLESLREEGEEELADGLYVEIWEQADLRQRAPYLSDIFVGAKYCPTDGVANPLLVPRALGWAARRLGAQILEHAEATGIGVAGTQITSVLARDSGGSFTVETPWVIHAAGPWSPELAQTLDIKLPVRPVRVDMAVTQPAPRLFTEFISSHDVGAYARPARSGHIHIGLLGQRQTTFDKQVPPAALQHLDRAVEMIPALAQLNILRTWAGTLAMTPDSLPIIGPVDSLDGLLLATGFSGHGFCLGPIVGKLMSEYIVEGETSLPIEEFRQSRFSPEP